MTITYAFRLAGEEAEHALIRRLKVLRWFNTLPHTRFQKRLTKSRAKTVIAAIRLKRGQRI